MRNRTWINTAGLAACAGLCMTSAAFAQAPEVEPNDTKAAATPVTLDGTAAIPANQITGTTTGTSTVTAGLVSADYWRVKTAAAPLGIYRHVLALSTTGTAGHTVTLRALSQSGNVIGTADNTLQTGSSTTLPARAVYWYGFGKQEEVYYRATGLSTTTASYLSTLTTTTQAAIVNAGTIYAGSIRIQTSNSVGTQDSEIWLYDSNFNPIVGAGADNVLAGASGTLNGAAVNSGFVRTLTPGTYYVAVGAFNLANNLASPTGDFGSGNVMDFPNGIVASPVNISTAQTVNVGMTDSAGNPPAFSQAIFPANSSGLVQFVQFTVVQAPIPTGTGSASPNPVAQGASTTLTIAVTSAPSSTLDNITAVTCDISSLTGNPSPDNLVLVRDGVTANWTGLANVNVATTPGSKTIPFSITDSTTAPGSGSFSVSVIVPPPANDQCAGAITVTTGAPAASASNATATQIGDPTPTCQPSFSKGIWYSFQAPANGIATIDTEGSVLSDTVLAVYDACGGTQIACDDDTGTGNLSSTSVVVTSGQIIKILVGSFGTTASGVINLNIAFGASGACCNNNTGVCTLTTSTGCLTGSTYQGDGSTCTPVSPCAPTGTCCSSSGGCTITTAVGCASPSVFTLGAGPCTPTNPCPQPSPCCIGTNACVLLVPSVCTGTFSGVVGVGTTCNAASCAASTNTDCATATALSLNQLYVGSNIDDPSVTGETPAPSCQASFKQSVWFTFTAPATAAYRISACGSPQDTVINVFTGSCATPTELPTSVPAGTDGCDDDTCAGGVTEPGPGGVSGSSLASDIASTRLVAGQTFLIRLSTFGTGTAGNYQLRITLVNAGGIGSCCETSGACTLSDATGCTGTFLAGGSCSPNICPQPTATCCRGSTCSVILPVDCVAGVNHGASTPGGNVCNASGVNTAPCCLADFNKMGGIEVNDIFSYLNDWFANSNFADFGGDGTTAPDVNDIFSFLNAWFAGGC
ncbi:MAG: hypothetical protein K2W85_14950 [Phycisphaerales bacterium]|nr:hypothetical protein [Phycisphaerales bacterium]